MDFVVVRSLSFLYTHARRAINILALYKAFKRERAKETEDIGEKF